MRQAPPQDREGKERVALRSALSFFSFQPRIKSTLALSPWRRLMRQAPPQDRRRQGAARTPPCALIFLSNLASNLLKSTLA